MQKISDASVDDSAFYSKAAELISRMAEVSNSFDDWLDARRNFERALTMLKAVHQDEPSLHVATVLRRLGEVEFKIETQNRLEAHLDRPNLTRARRYVEESVLMDRAVASEEELVAGLQLLGKVYRHGDNLSDARRVLEESLTLHRKLDADIVSRKTGCGRRWCPHTVDVRAVVFLQRRPGMK